jgi:hypothetical protein
MHEGDMSGKPTKPLPKLGRIRSEDPRDRNFMLPRQAPEPPKIHFKHWHAPKALDQGDSSACVGHAAHQLLKCSPIRNTKNIPGPFDIYRASQLVDEWPGAEPDYFGTSVRASVKVLKAQGYISAYRWAFDAATCVNHLLTVGPIIIGVDWYSEMFNPNSEGYIRPAGQLVGGHAVLICGCNTIAKNPDKSSGFVVGLNSWSEQWGIKGRFKLSMTDFDQLIRAQGEAAAVQEVYKPVPVA